MTWFIIAVVVIAIAVFAYLKVFDGKFATEVSLVINKPLDEVYAAVADLSTWDKWSPWVIHEPDVKITISESPKPNEVGGYYTWEGKTIGAGKLTHVALDPGKSITTRIEFLKPFKSQSEAGWHFEPAEGGTKATWWMRGQMPWFCRFMAKMVAGMIKLDYELGLAMLNGMLDPDSEHPQLEFLGTSEIPPRRCLTKYVTSTMDEIPERLKTGIGELQQAVQQKTGSPLVAFYKTDDRKDSFEYDIAIPASDEASGELAVKEIPGGRHMHVRMKGAYRFSPLAFYSAYSHLRMHKHKFDKSRPSLEVFENDPNEVASTNEQIISIYLPVQ